MIALYLEAAKIIDTVEARKGSVKSLVYNSKYSNKKSLLLLTCETLRYTKVLDEILTISRLFEKEKILRNKNLAKCLVFDLVFGRGLKPGHRLSDAVFRNSSALKSSLARLKVKAGVVENHQLLPNDGEDSIRLPRYARVNTLLTTVERVKAILNADGFKELSAMNRGMRYRQLVSKQYAIDRDIGCLLVFSPNLDMHKHTLYTSGQLILQDKASCLPAVVLAPPTGASVIDCCAAPGNKTSLLAALMSNNGRIFAFDKDQSRYSLMKKMLSRSGARCVECKCENFLSVDPDDDSYAAVTHLLVDPSCSGSGIVGRVGNSEERHYEMKHESSHSNSSVTPANSGPSKKSLKHRSKTPALGPTLTESFGKEPNSPEINPRLTALAGFQRKILGHALSFPSAQRVVYSTCSVHEEENELVVRDVLAENTENWSLADICTGFPNRGNSRVFPEAAKCVRLSPEGDETNGFFVACFERRHVKTKGGYCGESETCGENREREILHVSRKRKNAKKSFKMDDESRENNNNISDGLLVPKKRKKRRKNLKISG